jgi:hypothetical protein
MFIQSGVSGTAGCERIARTPRAGLLRSRGPGGVLIVSLAQRCYARIVTACTMVRGFGACAVETWSRMPLRGMHGACGAAVHPAREPPERVLKKEKKLDAR